MLFFLQMYTGPMYMFMFLVLSRIANPFVELLTVKTLKDIKI